jgi:site-specific recombinase XerD
VGSNVVVPLRRDQPTGEAALATLGRFLDRCDLKPHTVRAYRSQAAAYVAWLGANPGAHPDAFTDITGATAATKAWLRAQLAARAAPASINQGLAAVALLYQQALHIRPAVRRTAVARPGAPDALTRNQEGAVQRAADRRGVRDGALIAVLLGTGARVEECARLEVDDVPLTARTGQVRLIGKGDQSRTVPLPSAARDRLRLWLADRAGLDLPPATRPLWYGQRGALTISGITKVVLAVGAEAGLPRLRPHALRHTYATRLREHGADPAQIQALMGHRSIETTQRYFRASDDEVADLVERVFG